MMLGSLITVTRTRTRHGTVHMHMETTKENNMELIKYIPFDRYITRKELEVVSGQKDRLNRAQIEEYRKHPETFVISSSSKKGYKRPTKYEELEACRKECISRMKAELAKVAVIDKILNNRDQMGLGLV